MVKVTALTAFAHDRLEPIRGEIIELAESTAKELESRGLVTFGTVAAAPVKTTTPVKKPRPPRTKKTQPPSNKMAPVAENKAVQTTEQNGAPESSNPAEAG